MQTSTRKTDPEVSVVMPIYNRDAYLRPAIDSILNQTLQDFELIIVNDGSSNAECLKIIRDYESQDERVKVISQENAGLATARNTGIEAARGTYISFMDDDDICEPSYLEKQATFLNKHTDVAAVTPLFTFINTNGHIMEHNYPPNHLSQSPIIYAANPDIYKDSFSTSRPQDSIAHRSISKINSDMHKPVFQTQFWFAPNMGMCRASILQTVKFNPLFPTAEDTDITLRLMERYSTAIIPEYLYQYRLHEKHQSSLSSAPHVIHYIAAAFLCALYRKEGKPEPLQESADVQDLVPLFKELPFLTVAYCLKNMRHQLKRMLLSRQDHRIFTLLADLDKAFLDSEHAAYYTLVRKQALRKLRITALKRGKFLWLIKNSRRLANP